MDPVRQVLVPDDIYVPANGKLIIDGSQGPVQVFSHGTGIVVTGGEIQSVGSVTMDAQGNVTQDNSVGFDAEPDAASWDGIRITAGVDPNSGTVLKGQGAFTFTSIQHALTAISIDSGSTGSSDIVNYGLTVVNSGIGRSYFDGIDSIDTPVSVKGNIAAITGRPDGRFGTINNIGSQGIKVMFDDHAPTGVVDKALDVENMTFGSSVPFSETVCIPLQPCAAGTIGNDAIQATFGLSQPAIKLDNNNFYRAGSYGVELNGANYPQITNNVFVCNGSGSPTPVSTCTGTGLRYSAIYLNNAPDGANADLATQISGNQGGQNGLDALVLNGTVTSNITWITPTNDTAIHALGYIVANGDLEIKNSRLSIGQGGRDDVVLVKAGAIKLTHSTLDGRGSNIKTFTSMRDNSTAAVHACPSVFVQSCPSPVPSNEWTGLYLGAGSNATINDANIFYATTGVQAIEASTSSFGANFGLVLSNSHVGPTFGNGVMALDTPISLVGNVFGCPAGVQCPVPVTGNHGVAVDYSGSNGSPIGNGLQISAGNRFLGTGNEAIYGASLGGQTIDVSNNVIDSAGVAGIHLKGTSHLNLVGNQISNSGLITAANPSKGPAIWLDGTSNANFVKPPAACATECVTANTGSGNGLDAIAFHGATGSSLDWISAANTAYNAGASPPILGYVADDALTVRGGLNLNPGDYARLLRGAITVRGGPLTSHGAVATSLREQTTSLPTCGSIFVPFVNGACPSVPVSADYWGGFSLDPAYANSVAGSNIRYATTGLLVVAPSLAGTAYTLSVTDTTIQNVSGDGIQTYSPLSVAGGNFLNIGLNGIEQDMTVVQPPAPLATVDLSVTKDAAGRTSFIGTGAAAITSKGLDGATALVTDTSINAATTFGVVLQSADHVISGGGTITVTGNDVRNSGKAGQTQPSYPAIYLNGFSGAPANFANNTGTGNGLNALALHGTVTQDFTWITATSFAGSLGYLIDGDANLLGDFTVKAGDIVKTAGAISLDGGALHADGTQNASAKVFTSLTDNSIGLPACGSVLLGSCGATAAAGDWVGIALNPTDQVTSGKGSDFVNAVIRNARTGISVTSRATTTNDSSVFGLTVSRTAIGPSQIDGINSTGTALSVTDSTFSNPKPVGALQPAQHGLVVDFTGAPTTAALRFSGNRIVNTQAEGVTAQALANHPLWLTDNHIQGAGTFGVRLPSANELVLRNNNISSSGFAVGGPYPAIYLNNVTADFSRNVRGNVGRGNGLNAIVMSGSVTSDLNWVTPPNSNVAATLSLGYLLDGGLSVNGGNLNLKVGDVVKALGGPITLNGGSVNATGATFTSMRDNVSTSIVSCPSFFSQACDAHKGDWGGLVITTAGDSKGSGHLVNTTINYADTGIAIDSGPIGATQEAPAVGGFPGFRLVIEGQSKIENASKDGINTLDTPISVDSSEVSGVDGHGIIASMFSPPNCTSTPTQSPCLRLKLTGDHITYTGKDGIIANGLNGQPVSITGNFIENDGAYGIRLVGADQLTLTGNTIDNTGSSNPSLRYPAIYLNGVKADFETAAGVKGNHGWSNGLDAIVFHGEATNNLTWMTAGAVTVDTPFGYLLDDALTVDGTLSTKKDDVVKVLKGGIKINPLNGVGGSLIAPDRTLFTSLKDSALGHGIDACNSVFIPGPCPFGTATTSDWAGIQIDAGTSYFTNSTLLHASSGVSIAGAALHVSGATLVGISGTALTSTGTVPLTVDCSSIRQNGIGIKADYATVNDSDVYNNGTDLNGNANLQATNDDYLGPTPNTTTANATTIAAQQPIVSALSLTGDNQLVSNDKYGDPAFGVGKLTLKATFNRKMSLVAPLAAFGLYNANTLNFTGQTFQFDASGLTDNGWSADRKTWQPKDHAVDLLNAQAGYNLLKVSGGRDCIPPEIDSIPPTQPNPDSNLMTPKTQPFSASIQPTALTPSPYGAAHGPFGGKAHLQANLLANATKVLGLVVNFSVNGGLPVAGTTDANGDASVDASLGTLSVGVYAFTVSYAGDPDSFFTPAPSLTASPITAPVTVDKADTTTNLVNSTNNTTSNYGDTVTFTATVKTQVTQGINPAGEGSVTFTDTTTAATLCLAAPLGNGTNTASCTKNDVVAGAHSITATYNPATVSPNFTGSTSSALVQNVNKVTPTVATSPSAGGGIGAYISDSVTVSGGLVPGGTVTFRVFSPTDSTCTNAAADTFSNVALTNGMATSPGYQATASGDYHWIVDYTADANHNSVSGTCGDKTTITTDLATTTLLASQPTDVTTSLTSVTLTATVKAALQPNADPQAGTVAFFTGGNSPITCGTGSTTGLALTSTSNHVTCVTDYATVNGQKLSATYSGGSSGGSTYDASTGVLAKSSTSVASSAQGAIVSGDSVTFTATLNPTTADGTVGFFDGNTAIPGCTAQTVSGGLASCTTTSLTGTGTSHTVTAIYSGSSTYATSEGSVVQAIQ